MNKHRKTNIKYDSSGFGSFDSMSKKQATISALFRQCKDRGNFKFHNNVVKEVSTQYKFGNHYDATKLDHSHLLPQDLINEGYCVAHLGKGWHQFIQAKDIWYHRFEEIAEQEKENWVYMPSLLNHTDQSESNIISMVYNQRIVQKFLYNDITESPKIYLPRRTRITAQYRAGQEIIRATSLQLELDATFEHKGVVTIFEAKNKFPTDFSVYQLFHPYLYYHQNISQAKRIECCYLMKEETEEARIIRFYLYTFKDPGDISSINLIRKAQFTFRPESTV